MIYSWTPETCLKMEARLFFTMLRRGRMLEVNRKSREYFELCRIATYPQMAGKDKKELLTWHYENSLNDTERMVRAEKVKAIEKEAGFAPPDAGLSFFGQARLNR